MKKQRVGFMGTPDFSVPALEALVEAYQVPIVITQPDKPAGRKLQLSQSPVKVRALELGIPVLTPQRVRGNREFAEQIRNLKLDSIVVVAYGQILPQNFLDVPVYGCYNIHASLLPLLRGAAPIQRAILEGHHETGITIIRMDAGLDTGDMILKSSLEIGSMNAAQLHDALSAIGATAIVEALQLVFEGRAQFIPQNHELHTYAPKLRKEEGLIDWNHSALSIERRIRAFTPWPGCRFIWKGKEVKIIHAARDTQQGTPGKVLAIGPHGLLVACGQEAIRISSLQPQGKRSMDAHAFANGYGVDIDSAFITP